MKQNWTRVSPAICFLIPTSTLSIEEFALFDRDQLTQRGTNRRVLRLG